MSAMPKGYPLTACKGCDRLLGECGTLSTRGLCAQCSRRRIAENHWSMKTRSGPYWKVWKRSMAKVGGVVVLDERRVVLLDDDE